MLKEEVRHDALSDCVQLSLILHYALSRAPEQAQPRIAISYSNAKNSACQSAHTNFDYPLSSAPVQLLPILPCRGRGGIARAERASVDSVHTAIQAEAVRQHILPQHG